MQGAEADAFKKPILISDDEYVLDGNHRWLSHVIEKLPVNAYQLRLAFERAVEFLFKFPHTYSYGDGNDHSIIKN